MSIHNIKNFANTTPYNTTPYKEMYLTMVRASRDAEEMHRKADQILIEAMQKCEEMYISADDNKDVQ